MLFCFETHSDELVGLTLVSKLLQKHLYLDLKLVIRQLKWISRTFKSVSHGKAHDNCA